MSNGFGAELEGLELADGTGADVVRLGDEGAGVSIVVAPWLGGEMVSLKVRYGGEDLETLYRGMDFGPIDGWPGRAPLLFPQVGRCYVPSRRPTSPVAVDSLCSWEFDGRVLDMPMHGFSRGSAWELDGYGTEEGCAWACCELQPNDAIRGMYPFDFVLTVTHSLRDGKVVSRYDLTAGDNDRPMPFTMGNHIGLHAPFTSAGRLDEVRLVTPCTQSVPITDENTFAHKRPDLDLSEGVALAEERLWNLAVGGYAEGEAWALLDDPSSFAMRVSQRQVTPLFPPEHVLFVFWGERDRGYFCPEPWLGGPDALNTGEYCVSLASGEAFSWEMTVEARGRDEA